MLLCYRDEGKFDYFTFRYFHDIVFDISSNSYNFYPGHGATKLDLPIALYESWGREYCVILDSDKEGKEQQTRYIKELSNDTHIFTLLNIDSRFKLFTTEKLFSEDEKIKISKIFNPSLNTYNKSAFNTGIQILLSQKTIPDFLSQETKDNFHRIFEFLEAKFSKQ